MRFDPPTAAGKTLRPPSKPEVSELETMLGKLMASQARLEAAWSARSAEHETAMREVTGLGKCVADVRYELTGVNETIKLLINSQGQTQKRVNAGIVLAPGVITLIEISRVVFSHYFGGG